jgi:hypothetical protein
MAYSVAIVARFATALARPRLSRESSRVTSSIYTATREQAMAAFFDHARAAVAAADPATVEIEFRQAMTSLVVLHHAQAVQGALPASELDQFRRDSVPLLATPKQLASFILRAHFLAEGANDNQWYELSMRRSAIQIAIDDYPGSPVADVILTEDVEELDSELRALGQADEQGPIDPAYIPQGLPASHWWWHYPEQFK